MRALALLRMACGVMILVDLLMRLPESWIHTSDWGYATRESILRNSWPDGYFSLYLCNGSWAWTLALFAVAAVAAFGLLVGYRTRLCGIVSYVLLLSLQNRNDLVLDGGDVYLRTILFWAMFTPWGARWSLDSRSPEQTVWLDVAGVAYQLQVASLYLFAGLLKTGDEWRVSGLAIQTALSMEQITTPLAPLLLAHPQWLQSLTFAVAAFERSVPLWLFLHRSTRLACILVLIGLHLTFSVFLFIGMFGLVGCLSCLGMLPSFVLDRLERTRLANWLKQRFPGRSGQGEVRLSQRPWSRASLLGLMILTLGWNLGTLPDREVPDWYPRQLMLSLGLQQNWNLFSPNPSRLDGWYVVDARLVNGQRLDLYRDGASLDWSKPAWLGLTYRSFRWRKYLSKLHLKAHSRLRLDYARYLTRNWNSGHQGGERVESFEICYMLWRTRPGGGHETVKKVVLWKHDCLNPQEPRR